MVKIRKDIIDSILSRAKIEEVVGDFIQLKKSSVRYLGYLMRRVDSLEKTLMLGGIGGRRKRGRQRMGWLDVRSQ